jgi:O-antigen/teichoic acid export membrane protein
MSKTNRHNLTDGRSLARNTLVNLLGQGAPLLIGLIAIPKLLSAVGVERFGLLSISWLIIGYFSLFDLGLGRAITKLVAEEIGKDHENEIGPIVWTALSLMLIISIAGGLLVAAMTPWLTTSVIKIPIALQDESRQAFYLLAFAIPFVTLSAGLRGQLEAFQKFGFVNLIQVFLGILNFLGPLAIAMFTPNMAWIIFTLVVVRIVTCVAFLIGCRDVLSDEARHFQFQKSLVTRLLKFGGWLTVSNIISPIMTYCDRFLIGSILAIGSVAYYTTPYEIVTRLWIVPNAITRVLFPAFSTGAASGEDKTRQLFSQGLRGTFLILFPMIFLIFAFASEGMTLWLGKEFGTQSAPILRWLSLGVLINSVAWIPFVYIQSAERADLVAKLHVIELPLYLLSLWLLVKGFGVEGAAISWVLRLVVDMLALFILAKRIYPGLKSTILELTPFFTLCLLLLGACALIGSPWLRGAFVLVSMTGFCGMAWVRFMEPAEHEAIMRMLRLRKDHPHSR